MKNGAPYRAPFFVSAERSRVQTEVLILFLQLLLELFHGLPGLTQVVQQGAVGLLHAGLLLRFVFGIGDPVQMPRDGDGHPFRVRRQKREDEGLDEAPAPAALRAHGLHLRAAL